MEIMLVLFAEVYVEENQEGTRGYLALEEPGFEISFIATAKT